MGASFNNITIATNQCFFEYRYIVNDKFACSKKL